MARRSKDGAAPVSLFPMFNILVATLGVLVFIHITIVAISLGIGKVVVFVPSSGAKRVTLEPVYVEWTGSALVLHPEGERVAIEKDLGKIRTWDETYEYLDAVVAGSALGELFDEVARDDADRYVVLLTRPEGFDGLLFVRGYLDRRGIRIGYEPIEESLDFRTR